MSFRTLNLANHQTDPKNGNTMDQASPTDTRTSSSVSVFLYGALCDLATAEIANISAIGETKVVTIPYVTIFDDVLCTVRGVLSKNFSQYFEMIHPDVLPGKLEELKKEHPDVIIVNISDPDVALRLAELCCPLGIPFITLAPFSQKDHLKKFVEASSISAVVLQTEAVARTEYAEQEKILLDGVRAIILLTEKIAEGTNKCFLREELPNM